VLAPLTRFKLFPPPQLPPSPNSVLGLTVQSSFAVCQQFPKFTFISPVVLPCISFLFGFPSVYQLSFLFHFSPRSQCLAGHRRPRKSRVPFALSFKTRPMRVEPPLIFKLAFSKTFKLNPPLYLILSTTFSSQFLELPFSFPRPVRLSQNFCLLFLMIRPPRPSLFFFFFPRTFVRNPPPPRRFPPASALLQSRTSLDRFSGRTFRSPHFLSNAPPFPSRSPRPLFSTRLFS